MNNDERKLITDLAEQLKAMSEPNDAEAEALIQRLFTSHSDIAKLVQLILIQNMAIDQLKAKIQTQSQMVAAAKPQPSSRGFLDDLKEKLFGGTSAAPAAPSASVSRASLPAEAVPAQTQAMSGGGSSFLRQAMTVGAGVAGGMMLGNALESLFSHSNGSGSVNAGQQPNEIIENNYYDQDASSAEDNGYQDDPNSGNSNDISSDDNFYDNDSNDSMADTGFDDSSSGDW